jgi:3-hydroxyisobutyrate dehydrogenase
MQIGFIGLGHLGKTVAIRLLECRHSLTVWNRTPSKTRELKAEVVDSPAAVAECAVIFLCMFDSTAVQAVLTGEGGLLSGNIRGKIIVDLTTNHFNTVKTFHEICAEAGCAYLETPVLGSVVPASLGALTVLVSGEASAYDKVRPILDDIGKNIFYLEQPGLASKMKLINNLALGSFMATLAEALALAEDCGIARGDVLDILAAGAGNSMVLNAKKNKLLVEDFSTHFSNALIYKDLHCLQDLAFEQKKTLFTGSLVKELFAKTFELGFAHEDFSAIYKVFQRD